MFTLADEVDLLVDYGTGGPKIEFFFDKDKAEQAAARHTDCRVDVLPVVVEGNGPIAAFRPDCTNTIEERDGKRVCVLRAGP